ncbi:MAG: hypothetical protein LBQ96_04275 [Fusobacteriaceae bacterium]|jgi:TRAP-type C4-dicarboxylate transport system substrate-binding protein|nr:hypothetical protein [Fusobacteriaceae bacterium]
MIQIITDNYDGYKAKLEKDGIKFNEVDNAAFGATVKPVYEKMKGVTPGIYDILKAEIAKRPSK